MKSVALNRKIAQILDFLSENKEVKIGKLAFKMGVSYKHFKYYVVPQITAITECVEYNRDNDTLVWKCDGEV